MHACSQKFNNNTKLSARVCDFINSRLSSVNITVTEDKLRFIACLMLFLYAFSSLLAGHKGILSYAGLQSELSIANKRLNTLNDQQKLMRYRVTRLRSGSVDPDMADEQARLLLSYAEPDEIVVLLNHDGDIPQIGVRQAAVDPASSIR